MIFGQSYKLEGEILDKSNQSPLSFANITLQGTSLGAASDNEGRFSIEILTLGPTQSLPHTWAILRTSNK